MLIKFDTLISIYLKQAPLEVPRPLFSTLRPRVRAFLSTDLHIGPRPLNLAFLNLGASNNLIKMERTYRLEVLNVKVGVKKGYNIIVVTNQH
jgi:hypothetical protein